MENGVGFFKRHKLIIIGLGGVILGVILNSLVGDYKNRKFLSMLEMELNQLEAKSQNGQLTIEQKNLADKLKIEIYIMKFKCIA